MSKNELQQELKAKIKLGIKPSDLKKLKTMPKSADTYTEKLETEKAELLTKVANYEKEQVIAVNTFKNQAKLIKQKEEDLEQKDQEISKKEVAIEKLKERVQELAEKIKQLKFSPKFTDEKETTEIATQTTGPTTTQLEEQILEKRVQNIKDFGTYRDKLAEQAQTITLYQEQIKKLILQPNQNRDKIILVLTVLLIITGSLLLFK